MDTIKKLNYIIWKINPREREVPGWTMICGGQERGAAAQAATRVEVAGCWRSGETPCAKGQRRNPVGADTGEGTLRCRLGPRGAGRGGRAASHRGQKMLRRAAPSWGPAAPTATPPKWPPVHRLPTRPPAHVTRRAHPGPRPPVRVPGANGPAPRGKRTNQRKGKAGRW